TSGWSRQRLRRCGSAAKRWLARKNVEELMPVKAISQSYRESLLAELELHKTEFSALRAEILQWLDTERQLLNLSIVAIGAGFGFSPLILDQRLFIVFLLFPLVFHVLLAEMLTAMEAVATLSHYLSNTLIPRVNVILDALGNDRQNVVALGWEIREAKRIRKAPGLVWASITPTRHWVPILAVAACLIAYGVLTGTYNYTVGIGELVLILANLVFLVLAAVQNVLIIARHKQGTS
ncbi:MAG: hypothetical protein ACUVSG_08815, partial [Anaerolineae bacterium]